MNGVCVNCKNWTRLEKKKSSDRDTGECGEYVVIVNRVKAYEAPPKGLEKGVILEKENAGYFPAEPLKTAPFYACERFKERHGSLAGKYKRVRSETQEISS